MATVYVFNTTEQSLALMTQAGASCQVPGTYAGEGFAPGSAQIELDSPTELSVQSGGAVQQYQVDPAGSECQLYIFPGIMVLTWVGGQSVLSPAPAPSWGEQIR